MGLAYKKGKKIAYKKGIFDVDEFQELIKKLPFPYALHFRTMTKGDKSPELCHPFPITANASLKLEGTADSVLFHNGTFAYWEDYLLYMSTVGGIQLPDTESGTTDVWSDSRAIALLIHKYGMGFLNLIDNRFLVMDAVRGPVKLNFWFKYSIEATQGDKDNKEQDDGMSFSNNYWNVRGV